jgi:hypothetical protein
VPDDRFNGIDIELNLYERGGRWAGEYILTTRSGLGILNEVSSLSELGDTWDEARQIVPETLDLLYRKHVTGDVEVQEPAERRFQRRAGR